MSRSLASARLLCVGLGGLGSPAALALVRAGLGRITLLEEDRVEESNLHRQILYTEADLGRPKAEVAAERLLREAHQVGHRPRIEPLGARLLPEEALALFASHDLVLEGTDNFESKFLALDAAAVTQVPVVQGGVVRWSGWALLSAPGRVPGAACLRCLFEDVPEESHGCGCSELGVVGSAAGVVGLLQAALSLRWLLGDTSSAGERWSYEGRRGRLRRAHPRPRSGCPACRGALRATDIVASRYVPTRNASPVASSHAAANSGGSA